MEQWIQLLKFGVVGVVNNGIYYLVYLLLIRLKLHYLAASILGFLVSVGNAGYWNSRYVFAEKDREQQNKRCWWKIWLKTCLAYGGTGLVLNNLLLILLVDALGISPLLGPMVTLCVTVPLNFLLNKYWTFGSAEKGSRKG